MRDKNKWIVGGSVLAAIVLVIGGFIIAGNSISVPDDYDYDDLTQFIELGDYKHLEYVAFDSEVTESEVMSYIYSEMEGDASTENVYSGTVNTDSVAVIDYCGRYDGKEVDGAVAEGVVIDMTTKDYLPGFVEGIVGHKVGDTFVMKIQFPEGYAGEYGGKLIDFTVTVQALQKTVLPEYNNEYVKKHTEYSSTKAYEKAVRKDLEAKKKNNNLANEKLELFNLISEKSKVKEYPEKEYKARYNQIVNTYLKLAEDNDIDFDTYLAQEMGMSEEEFYKQAEESAKNAVKQELILRQIAREEGIDISKSDYQDYLDGLLKDAGYTKASYKKENGISFKDYAESNYLYSSLLYERVMTRVLEMSNAK